MGIFARRRRNAGFQAFLSGLGGAAVGGALGYVGQNAWQNRNAPEIDARFTPVSSAPVDARVYTSSLLRGGDAIDPETAARIGNNKQIYKTDRGFVEASPELVRKGSESAERLWGEQAVDNTMKMWGARGGVPTADGQVNPQQLNQTRAFYDTLLRGPQAASQETSSQLRKWDTPEWRQAVMQAKQRLAAGKETAADNELLSNYEGDVLTHMNVRGNFDRAQRTGQEIGEPVSSADNASLGERAQSYARLLPFYGSGQDIHYRMFGNNWDARAYNARTDQARARHGWYTPAGAASTAAELAMPAAGMIGGALKLTKVPSLVAAGTAMTPALPSITGAASSVAQGVGATRLASNLAKVEPALGSSWKGWAANNIFNNSVGTPQYLDDASRMFGGTTERAPNQFRIGN
jgi:hypothetical protein